MSFLSEKFSALPHSRVVQYAMSYFATRLKARVNMADYEGVAWAAYHRFMFAEADGLEGAKLERHLFHSVRNAVVDELRRADPLAAWTRRLVRSLKKEQLRLTIELGREPTLEELSCKSGISQKAAKQAMHAAIAVDPRSLDEMSDLGDIGPRDEAPLPGDPKKELKPVLFSAMATLSMIERHILERTFFDGCSNEEVSKEVGLSAARIGQIKTVALGKMKKQPAIKELAD